MVKSHLNFEKQLSFVEILILKTLVKNVIPNKCEHLLAPHVSGLQISLIKMNGALEVNVPRNPMSLLPLTLACL